LGVQGAGSNYFRIVKPFRGGLVFKVHRLVYNSTLGLRVIKKSGRSTSLGDERAGGPAVERGRKVVRVRLDLQRRVEKLQEC